MIQQPPLNLPYFVHILGRLFLLCFPVLLFGQEQLDELDEFAVLRERTFIHVQSLEEYSTEHIIEGDNPSASEHKIAFSISQSSIVESLNVTTTSNGKTRKLNVDNNLTISTIDWSSFFSGNQTYILRIPANCSFTITYKTIDKETIFLTRLIKKGNYASSNCFYQFKLPVGLVLTTDVGNDYSGESIWFDSTSFAVDQEQLFYLIHPATTQVESYFSKWFEERVQEVTAMNPTQLPAELEVLNKSGDRTQLAAACFSYVQNAIRYVDIENGIHAILPRSCNETMENKYGDCKDMATLLHALYKQYGFESYLTISKTFIKKDTFDFPSIGLANHMIVSLKLNGKFIFLDATEDDCLFGDPSNQILGTEAFLIGHSSNYFVQIPAILLYPPTVDLKYTIRKTAANVYQLTTELSVKGKSNQVFNQFSANERSTTKKTIEYLSFLYPNSITMEESAITDTASRFVFTSYIPANLINEIGTQTYLDMSYLPDIQQLSLFFSGMQQPTYTTTYTLLFSGVLPSKPPLGLETVVVTSSVDALKMVFQINQQTLQATGDATKTWKSLVSKPFKINL